MYLTLRIIEKILIIYFTIYFVIDIVLYVYSIYSFFRKRKKSKKVIDFAKYPISIVVPAYNEEVSIVTCSQMLAKLDYPNFEVIIVNDGSIDNTMDILTSHYKISRINKVPKNQITTHKVKGYYETNNKNVKIIDKENGGKADAVNVGINYSSGDYICTIDADSILDEKALKEVIAPFIKNKNTIVSGGQLAVSNDVIIIDNKVVNSKVPRNIWVQWQIIEYIKSFLISRIGLSKINALLIMSGAFSLFKKEDLLCVGGFLNKNNDHSYIEKNVGLGKQTVCEDMEIVVRLWKYKRDNNIKAKAEFLPEPVCWTEVPESPKNLYKQRSRWHQGLGETIAIYRNMIFEPKYGVTGLFGLPYYFLFEFLSPIIKVISLIFIIVATQYGIINLGWVLLLLTSVLLTTAIITSSIMAVIEYWSKSNSEVNRNALRYNSFFDWLWLILSGILAEFSYSFFKIATQINGIYNLIRKKHNWKKFDRKGIRNI